MTTLAASRPIVARDVTEQAADSAGRTWLAAAAWPAGIFIAAFAARIVAMFMIHFPLTEGSAYYLAVARNMVAGRGLVVDSIWSYSTPPLTLPRPAFELWQPLASLIAAAPMTILGSSLGSAQLAFAIVGAVLAPLAYVVARDAADRLGLSQRRVATVAVGSGLLVALGGPFVLPSAVPDSTLPFAVIAVGACIIMRGALAGQRWPIVGLGILAGLAYLTRMEAIYLGIAFLVVGWTLRTAWGPLARRATAVTGIAALVAVPWWLRNLADFGTPLPSQVTDNLLLTHNEQIFAFTSHPTLAGFTDQGVPTIVANIGAGLWHDLVDVTLVPGAAFAVLGVLTLAAGWRHRHALVGSPLSAMVVLGTVTFAATSVLFPVATLWGTFEHAAGPLLVALAVLAALGGDAMVARIREWRSWPRSNAWLAPAALLALTIPLVALQLSLAANQAAARQRQLAAVALNVPPLLGTSASTVQPLITDHPIWLADALGRPAIVLPDEPLSSVLALATKFNAPAVVILEPRGIYPDALRSAAAAPCFTEMTPPTAVVEAPDIAVFLISEACR